MADGSVRKSDRLRNKNGAEEIVATPLVSGTKARRKVEKNDGDENAVPIELIGEQLLPEDAFCSWVMDELVKMEFHTIYNASNGNKLSDIVMYFMHNAFRTFDVANETLDDDTVMEYPSYVLVNTYDLKSNLEAIKNIATTPRVSNTSHTLPQFSTKKQLKHDAIVSQQQALVEQYNNENDDDEKSVLVQEIIGTIQNAAMNGHVNARKRDNTKKVLQFDKPLLLDEKLCAIDDDDDDESLEKWDIVKQPNYSFQLLLLQQTTALTSFLKMFNSKTSYKKIKDYNDYKIVITKGNDAGGNSFRTRIQRILDIMDFSDFKERFIAAYMEQYPGLTLQEFDNAKIFDIAKKTVAYTSLYKVICPTINGKKKRDGHYKFLQLLLNCMQVDLYTKYLSFLVNPSHNFNNETKKMILVAYNEREKIYAHNKTYFDKSKPKPV